MRIAIHYPHLGLQKRPTGVGKHMLNMTLGLACREGCDVSLLTSRKGLDETGLVPNDLPTRGLRAEAYPFSDNLMQRLWKYAGIPSADHWCKHADWIYAPGETFVATNRARFATSVHAIHFFDPHYADYHSPETARARVRWRYHLDRVFRNASLVFTPSDFLRDRLAELYPARSEDIVTVGNGVEENFFQAADYPTGDAADPNHSDGEGPYLIAVGGLHDIKGARELLRLAADLNVRAPDIRIVVVGRNDPSHEATAKAQPNVILKGYMRIEDGLPQLMRGALAALVLSRYETFGIPALEAMAAGTAVISSRAGALPQTVGDAAILCEPEKTGELVDNILDLVHRPGVRDDLVARGMLRAKAFHWRDCVTRAVEALRSRM